VVATEILVLRVPAPFSLNYGEGFVQLDILRAAAGDALYGNPAQPPYTIQVYTPLYLWLSSALVRLGAGGYTAGRLLGYGAVLGTAAVVVLSAPARRRATATGVAACYLTLPLFVTWGAVVRPDNLAVLLSAAGIALLERSIGRRAVAAALLLFLAAGMTKQSSVAAPAAACLWLLPRAPRRALGLGAGLALAAALCAAALQWASGGWFWLHAVASHDAKPFAWARAAAVWGHFLAYHAPLAAFALGLVAWLALRRRASASLLWLALSTLATASAGKSGSDTNYWLEPVAALALLAARELPVPLAPGAGRPRRVAAWAGTLAALTFAASNAWLHHLNHAWIPAAGVRFQASVARFGAAPGQVIADDAGFLIAAGKPLFLRPFIMTQLAEAGRWDEGPVLDAIESGRVGLWVVQREPEELLRARYTPAQRRLLQRRFQRAGSYRTDFEYEIWVPQGARLKGRPTRSEAKPSGGRSASARPGPRIRTRTGASIR
jgi:hypothetical protein